MRRTPLGWRIFSGLGWLAWFSFRSANRPSMWPSCIPCRPSASEKISATGVLPAITNGRTKKCLPSGEPVSRKRETLSRMTGHECDRRNVKSANVVDASSSVMFVLPVIEAIKRFHVGDFTGFDEHVQRSGGGRSAVGRLRHGQQRGVNVVRHFHTLSRFEVVF